MCVCMFVLGRLRIFKLQREAREGLFDKETSERHLEK